MRRCIHSNVACSRFTHCRISGQRRARARSRSRHACTPPPAELSRFSARFGLCTHGKPCRNSSGASSVRGAHSQICNWHSAGRTECLVVVVRRRTGGEECPSTPSENNAVVNMSQQIARIVHRGGCVFVRNRKTCVRECVCVWTLALDRTICLA